METSIGAGCADGAASRAEGANLTVVLEAELERDMAYSERDDVKRAAARLANALKDIFNDVGELPEVRERFENVYRDVSHYAGLERIGL